MNGVMVGRAAFKRKQMEERIYCAGMELFQEKGFTQTTLKDICEKANVSKGTIFNYFSSKEDILAKFGRDSLKRLKEFAENLPQTMGTKEKIIAVLMEDFRGVKESEVYAKITLKGIAEGGDLVYQLEAKNRQELSAIYESIIKEGLKTSSPRFNTTLVSDLIVAIYFHCLENHFMKKDSRFDYKEYIKTSVDLLFHGIGKFIKEN